MKIFELSRDIGEPSETAQYSVKTLSHALIVEMCYLSNESYIKPSLRKLKNRSSKDQLENNLDICQNKAHFSKMKDNKIQTVDIIKQCLTHYPKLLQFPKGRRM